MSQYTSQYPNVPDDSALKKYYEEFYKAFDTPEAREKYVNHFRDDATMIMASKMVKSRPEILNMRKSMWEHVASRPHKPEKIFPFGPNADEVMILGPSLTD
ncbi:MAG: hypothetical protein FRX48_00069 [Lasallia pustulata]|uniref:Uncharacterized protein n=1 Tax=Lasallia pustulata TaxID=136370 RepID=A0A5M8PZP2_9LECA|nr:MAG: hypothetical protein FRX48_00069 [Lasallia pustulata]